MVRPASPGLLRAIRHLPVNARLAGVSEELNAVPALTGRAITASTEHAIPWHMGYYAPLERNLKLALLAVSTPDPGIAAAAIKGTGAGYLLVDQGLLAHSIIPERYGKIVPAEVAAAQNAFNSGPSFMQRNAQACAIYRAPTAWLLDAGCLHRTAS
jgi:hypothetical protein